MTGESPLGHVELHLVATHALWDSGFTSATFSYPLA